VIEQNNYNEKSEENLEVTVEKLLELEEIFKDLNVKASVDSEIYAAELALRQKIFKHLEGHNIVLRFIEMGAVVLEENFKYFDVTGQAASAEQTQGNASATPILISGFIATEEDEDYAEEIVVDD
jgi:hypothetical protein